MAHVQDRWTSPAGVDGRGRPKREPNDLWGRGKRWRATWQDRPGHRGTKTFISKDAAVAHLARVAVDQHDGRYVAAGRDKTPIGDLWTPWRAGKLSTVRPVTMHGYDCLWRAHVGPRWQPVQVRAVTRGGVNEWAAGLPLAHSRRRTAILVLSALLDYAVEERMLPNNSLRGMRLPTATPTPVRALTEAEVHALAQAMTPHDTEVWTLALTGIRWSEMAGLQVGDLDVPRGRLQIARGYVEVAGRGMIHPTKTGRIRHVPVRGVLLDRLSAAATGRASTEPLLAGPRFTGWTSTMWRRRWANAVRVAGLDGVGTHALRHTAASLAIAAGADVKVVQRMLGHASATMTLDLYAHMLDRSLDDVGERLAGVFRLDQ